MRIVLVLLAFLWSHGECRTGIDFNSGVFTSDMSNCLKGNGTSFIIFAIQRQDGNVLYDGLISVLNARLWGWEDVSAYISPCLLTGCASAYAQVEQAILALQQASATVNSIFIDFQDHVVFDDNHGWGNPSMAQGYLDDAARAFDMYKMKWGIFTDKTSWDLVLPGVMKYSNRLLWYPGDTKFDYSDFVPFGGWTRPTIKFVPLRGLCDIDGVLQYKP